MRVALLALLVLTACSSATAAATATRTGGHVIFVSDRDGDNDVYAISGDGRRVAALTRNNAPEASVVISPSGNWIGELRGSSAGVLVSADGRRERRLPGIPEVFSADGRLVALETGTSGNWGIATIRTDGRALRRFGPGVPTEFSPGGRWLAFWDEASGIGVVDLSTGRRTMVIKETPTELGSVLWSPSWSQVAWVQRVGDRSGLTDELVVRDRSRPDAPPTVLTRGTAPAGVSWLSENRLLVGDAVIRTDGSVVRTFGKTAQDVQVSPRKDAVAYYEWNDPLNRTDPTLFLARLDGSRTDAVNLIGSASTLAWSPSGRFVAVAVRAKQRNELQFVDVARRRVIRTTRLPLKPDELRWSPDDARVLVDKIGGRNVVIASRTGQTARVAMYGNTQVIGWMKGPLPHAAPKASSPPR